jgi:hypothetical protein
MRAKWGECSDSWLSLLPAFTAGFPTIGTWKVVSSYSSATVSDFHGISRIHLLTNFIKRTNSGHKPSELEVQVFLFIGNALTPADGGVVGCGFYE